MADQRQADRKKKLDEDEEQSAAKDEPMGSVAAAVPRDAGSAANDCGNHAPPHKGGPATLVAGKETHQAEKADEAAAKPGKDVNAVRKDLRK